MNVIHSTVLLSVALQLVIANDKQLQMAIEICRHGARSPANTLPGINVTQAYWPLGIGMLTEMGQRQHYMLGRELRRRYVEDLKILDPVYNASQVLVYSTFKERCYQSA